MSPNDREAPAQPPLHLLKVAPSFRERVWGDDDISFLYPHSPAMPLRVGEAWLTAGDNRVESGHYTGSTLGELCRSRGAALLGVSNSLPVFPLLIKFLFTRDKLSLQVHPPDSYARVNEGSAGKTEMWHVIRADKGAAVGIGFRPEYAQHHREGGALGAALKDGSIEGWINWIEARAGDTFFVPAGTVHAIGAGLVICEIQQNSDVTYRLYDYNRPGSDGKPRELHLDRGLQVMEWSTAGGRTQPLALDAGGGRLCLAACPYFAVERLSLHAPTEFSGRARCEIWIGLEGEAQFDASGGTIACAPGEVVIVAADTPRFSIHPRPGFVGLRTFVPDLRADVQLPLHGMGYSEDQLRGVFFP